MRAGWRIGGRPATGDGGDGDGGTDPSDPPSGPSDPPSDPAEPPSRRPAVIRAALIVAGLVLVFVVGWLGSALWFSPAPLLPEERTVPRAIGLRLEDATAGIERVELRARLADQRSHPTAARGVVIWQDPAPGTAVPMNTSVQLTTSAGPGTVAVPDLTGFVLRDAVTVLKAAGLVVGEIDTIAAIGEPGVVLGTRPSAGSGRAPGGAVGLIVTAGDPPARRTRP